MDTDRLYQIGVHIFSRHLAIRILPYYYSTCHAAVNGNYAIPYLWVFGSTHRYSKAVQN
jgi:hypothetical protein